MIWLDEKREPQEDNMAVTETVTALIAAGGVALGAVLTGGFALASQWITRRAEERKAVREADERERTRFHEIRRETYASFLGSVSDALGFWLNLAIKRQKETGKTEDNETFSDAPKRMTRQQAIISMISGSRNVRQAAEELVTATTAVGLQEPNTNTKEWNRQIEARLEDQRQACQRFIDVANAELTSPGSSASAAVSSRLMQPSRIGGGATRENR